VVVLAVGGAVGYLMWPNLEWWNFGGAAAIPLVLLVVATGDADGEPVERAAGGISDGPWGPP
jgi:hypothetical protein